MCLGCVLSCRSRIHTSCTTQGLARSRLCVSATLNFSSEFKVSVYRHLDDKRELDAVLRQLRSLAGIYTVLGREDASRELELPADRIGDVVVVADGHTVLGRSVDEHDLSSAVGLRSHGSFEERVVPMFFNRSILPSYAARFHSGRVRNFQLYELLCNGLQLDGVAPATTCAVRQRE